MSYIILAFKLLPLLIEVATQLQARLPEGTGSTKLALILATLKQVFATIGNIQKDLDPAKTVQLASDLTDNVVVKILKPAGYLGVPASQPVVEASPIEAKKTA